MPRRRQPPGHHIPEVWDRVLAKFKILTSPSGNESLEIRNLKVSTDIKGAEHVLVIDGQGSPGMQHPIGVDGYVKCVICAERAFNRLICAQCETAIHFVRAISSKLSVADLVNFDNRLAKLDDAGLLEILRLVTVDFLRDWMQKQVEDLDEG